MKYHLSILRPKPSLLNFSSGFVNDKDVSIDYNLMHSFAEVMAGCIDVNSTIAKNISASGRTIAGALTEYVLYGTGGGYIKSAQFRGAALSFADTFGKTVQALVGERTALYGQDSVLTAQAEALAKGDYSFMILHLILETKGKSNISILLSSLRKIERQPITAIRLKKSLLRTNELPSNKRIPQNDSSVNSNSMQKSKKDAQNISGDNKDVRFNLSDGNGDVNNDDGGYENGFGEENSSKELGWLGDSSETKAFGQVGEVGQIQQETPNTPHTRRIHRNGVSARIHTSSGLTAEQAALKQQNKIEGVDTEFYVNAKEDGVEQSDLFHIENTLYYLNSAFEREDILINIARRWRR